ncbi:D-2-hydroxyacid dehydrogenase [Rubritalea spongiae]|uniref:D-2-hydroxyacid dehydrogenase n=1 Tax=Rubritalea spongiae TaxID=430797 RepID=A0ABW5E186_9BACT
MNTSILARVLSTVVTLTAASSYASPSQNAKALAEEVGSLRGAKVAIAMADEKKQLTYFASSLDKNDVEALKQSAPNVKVITGLSKEEALARADEAHGISGRFAETEFLNKATNLKWIQTPTAGVDRYIAMPSIVDNDAIVLTNCRGVHGPAIADHAMAMLLYQTRNLAFYSGNQEKKAWVREGTPHESISLKGKTMLVVGLGGIGSEIAQRAHGFGMRVIGTRRSDSPSASFIEKVGKPKDLLSLLPEADVVALAIPLTDETKDLFNAEAFSAMKEGSYLINIARGPIVNTDALIDSLKSGKLAGACLDVTDPEPLPADHPLWDAPNTIITPHIAWSAAITGERRSAVILENIRRFGAGEPLLNTVDKAAGY